MRGFPTQISGHGHTLLAELTVHYLQTQIQLMPPYDVYNTDGDSLEGTNWVSNLTEIVDSQSQILHGDKKAGGTSDIPGASRPGA